MTGQRPDLSVAVDVVWRVLAGVSRLFLGLPGAPRRAQATSRLWRALSRSSETSSRFALIASAAYLVMLIWGHSQHEFWRDEIHPWIVARQADGFWDLVTGDRRYDGHPPGWFWYLRLFTFITRDPLGLHVATILLGAAGAFLFLRFAPFARPLRLLLTFSFLFAFEYGVMSRNYSLGLPLTFLFCVLLQPLRRRPLGLALCLVGIALSSVYGAIVAAALLLVLLAHSSALGRYPLDPGAGQIRIEKGAVLATLLVVAAVVFSVLSSRPPDPNPYAPGINLAALDRTGVDFSLARLTWSTLPLRNFNDIGYWGGIDLVWRDHPVLFTWVCRLLAVAMLLVLVASPVELFAFVSGSTLMAVVQLAVYPGSLRHWGHYLILFLALCWTARQRHPRRRSALMPLLLLVIGGFQFTSLVVALREEQRWSFSGGPETAAYIQRAGLAGTPIVGGPDWAMPAVMGYLDQDFISCETAERNQTLVFHGRRRFCAPFALAQKAVSVVQATHAPVLVVSIGRVPGAPPTGVVKELLFESRKPTAAVEDFAVYRYAPASGGAPAVAPRPAQGPP